jgi:hypothetical protein
MIPTGGISGGVGNNIQAFAKDQVLSSFYVYQQAYDTNGKPIDGVYVDRNNDGIINSSDKYFSIHLIQMQFLVFLLRLLQVNGNFLLH